MSIERNSVDRWVNAKSDPSEETILELVRVLKTLEPEAAKAFVEDISLFCRNLKLPNWDAPGQVGGDSWAWRNWRGTRIRKTSHQRAIAPLTGRVNQSDRVNHQTPATRRVPVSRIDQG